MSLRELTECLDCGTIFSVVEDEEQDFCVPCDRDRQKLRQEYEYYQVKGIYIDES